MPLDLDGHVSTLVLSFILKSQSLSETPLIVTPVFIIGVYQQKKLMEILLILSIVHLQYYCLNLMLYAHGVKDGFWVGDYI